MKLTMFKRAKPRGFNYKPIHYDPVKEAREERRKELLGEDAASPYDQQEEKQYNPGQYIRSGGIRRSRPGISSREADKHRATALRSMIALAALAGLTAWLYAGPRAGIIAVGAVAAIFFVVIRLRNASKR